MQITHQFQQKFWEDEHAKPLVLPSMSDNEPSGVVVKFFEWLRANSNIQDIKGIEMGCGKGRNTIFFAKNGINMTAFDFANSAIIEAKNRAKKADVENLTQFIVHDATEKWPFADASFDFAIDNFASTDIESKNGREFARDEMIRVVKPKGYIYVSTLSSADKQGKQELIEDLEETGAYVYKVGGKYEKAFGEREVMDFYKDLRLIAKEKIKKTANFFGKDYPCLHWWLVFKK